MPGDKETAIKNVIEKGGEILEIDLDENGRDEYKITLPLSYDFDFSPADGKGENIPVSSIKTRDTSTIINVPGDAPRWKLKVIKPGDRSGHDGQGTSSSVSENEAGDRFVDWLNVKAKDMQEPDQKAIQNAKREIIIRKRVEG
jgi:hypothetical protein